MLVRKAVSYIWDLKEKRIERLDNLNYQSPIKKAHEGYLNKRSNLAQTFLGYFKKYFGKRRHYN